MGEERIGSYRIVRKLGQGGMGEVFEAVHETIERRVAIKLLRPERARNAAAAARFFNEARAVNRIDHPGLVQVSDYGETPEGSIYIVMELLRGETLGQRLARRGRLALGEVLLLCRQAASVLVAVHEKGIIHRVLLLPSTKQASAFHKAVFPSKARGKMSISDYLPTAE